MPPALNYFMTKLINLDPDMTLRLLFLRTAILEKTGNTAISLGSRDTNIARACVLPTESGYEVWYPYVSKSVDQYRIGYGKSDTGLTLLVWMTPHNLKSFHLKMKPLGTAKPLLIPHIF